MRWLRRSTISHGDAPDPRVAASLADLRALEFRARGFSFLPRQPARSVLTGRHSSRLRGRGLNFEELRHYQPGDDIRSLDWKVTRRTGKPHVRVYTEERERSVLLLVDQRVSMFFGSVSAMKSVVAARVAALAAWRVLASGDRIGALVFDDRHCHSIPDRRSRDSVMALLGRLVTSGAALRAGQRPEEKQLAIAFEALDRRLSHDALVIYIGDGFGWDSRAEKLLQRISLHNDVLVVNIHDPAEEALPPLDEIIVSDGDLQISVAGNRERLAERFGDSYRADMGRMRDELRRLQVPVINVDTVRDPVEQVLEALGGIPR
jgi:uncharacterized protein (DUF58 family)